MSLFKLKFLPLLLVFFMSACKDGAPEINSVEQFDQYVEEEMQAQDIPALSVLVFRENEVLHERLFGEANLEQGTPLTAEHLFLQRSISKTITAVALLQLHEDGHFSLDDPINDYLPFEVKVPNQSTDITFRMLLTHTSAIADGSALDGEYYYGQDSPVALDDFMENYLVPGGTVYDADESYHDFEPGTEHEYSNVGSALIGVLVEAISGMGFNAYCKTNIFGPLGMDDTFWRLDEISQPIATPYYFDNGSHHPIDHYTNTDYPNGGLRSTTRDLFKFLSTLAMGGSAGNIELLKPATVQAMRTPQIPNIDGTMGLHFFIMDQTNGLWGHDGGEQGVSTTMAFNPDDKTGAIILTNFSDSELDKMLRQAYLLGKGL